MAMGLVCDDIDSSEAPQKSRYQDRYKKHAERRSSQFILSYPPRISTSFHVRAEIVARVYIIGRNEAALRPQCRFGIDLSITLLGKKRKHFYRLTGTTRW